MTVVCRRSRSGPRQSLVMRLRTAPSPMLRPRAGCGQRIVATSSPRRRRASWRPKLADCSTPCSTLSHRRYGHPATPWLPSDGLRDQAAERGRHTIEPLPVLRVRRSVPPGGAAKLHTGLRNEGPNPVEIGFVWSELVAGPDSRIHASCLRLLPGRLRVPSGTFVDLTICLDVPDDARPGLYQALLQATERVGLRALLTFPVGLER